MDVLAAAENASSGSVYVVFQHRHGSGARRAHKLLQSGALGIPQVAVCETLWYRPDSYFLPEWRGNWAGEGGGPTLGHGIHQIDLLLHLMGSWETIDARAARIARPVEFEDVSLAIVTFESGAAGTVVTSLLSPKELSRIRVDTTGGTLEVDHVYGYRDADWSWTPAPDATTAASLGRDPGLPSGDGPGAESQQAARMSGPPPPVWIGPAITRLRSISWSTICSPAAATTPRWQAPGRRWSSSPRSTHRPSSAKQFTDGISLRPTASTTPSMVGCLPT
jgi:predicted dehydrogenase